MSRIDDAIKRAQQAPPDAAPCSRDRRRLDDSDDAASSDVPWDLGTRGPAAALLGPGLAV
jgi:hypothetical protein